MSRNVDKVFQEDERFPCFVLGAAQNRNRGPKIGQVILHQKMCSSNFLRQPDTSLRVRSVDTEWELFFVNRRYTPVPSNVIEYIDARFSMLSVLHGFCLSTAKNSTG